MTARTLAGVAVGSFVLTQLGAAFWCHEGVLFFGSMIVTAVSSAATASTLVRASGVLATVATGTAAGIVIGAVAFGSALVLALVSGCWEPQ